MASLKILLPFLCSDPPQPRTTVGTLPSLSAEIPENQMKLLQLQLFAHSSSEQGGSLGHTYCCVFFFFFSQEQLGWEPLQAPLQKWGGLWTTGQTAQGGGQDSPWQWAACLCSATLMRQASNPSGKPSDQREKKREITKKMNYNEWFRKIFLSPSWKWLTNSKNTKGINIVNSRTVYELTWLIKQQSIPHCL